MSEEEALEVVTEEEETEVEKQDDNSDGSRTPKILKPVLVPTDQVRPNDWNPFEQEDETFNLLMEEVQDEDFDEPIRVSPIGDGTTDIRFDGESGWEVEHGDQCYRIVDGEHRWKVARVLDMPLIPCIIKTDWDEKHQQIQTVRRNMIKGELNARKFTNLVEKVAGRLGIGAQAVARKMGMFDETKFARHYLKKKQKTREANKKRQETRKSVQAVENMTATLNKIFRESGGTVQQGYVSFAYKGQVHLLISMDGGLKRTFDALVEFLEVSKADANSFIREALDAKLLTTRIAADEAADVYVADEPEGEGSVLET